MSTTKWGAEFAVNTLTSAYQEASDETALTNRRCVVTSYDHTNQMSRAQFYNADGSRAGADFLVEIDMLSNQSNPAVNALSCSGFMLAWEDFRIANPDLDDQGIRAQIFNPDGTPMGGNFQINVDTMFAQ